MPHLIPHDGVSEVFVCRDCCELVDPVTQAVEGTTCPYCGGQDTAWLFGQEDDGEQEERGESHFAN